MSPTQAPYEARTRRRPSPRHRPLLLLLALVAALALGAVPAPAASAQTLAVGSTQGPAGAEVSVGISLTGVEADHLQVDLGFDEAVLTPTSVAAGPALDGHGLEWAVVAPGLLRVVVHWLACPAAAPAPSRAPARAPASSPADRVTSAASLDDGVAVLVAWEIAADATPGTYPLPVADAILAAGAGTPVDAATEDGAVEVIDGLAVPEIPTLGEWALVALALLLLAAGTWVLRRGARAGVAAVLAFLMAVQPLVLQAQPRSAEETVTAPTASAPAEPRAHRAAAALAGPGDADGDGYLTAADRQAVLDEILGRGAAAGDPDCDGSGTVDVLDVACITNLLCAADANQPPSLAPIADASLRQGEIYTAQASASDPDPGDVLTFRLMEGPRGMAVDPRNGSLLWVPGGEQAGAATARLRVTDSGGLFAERQFSVAVRRLGGPPSLGGIADRETVVGTPVALTAVATDPDLPDDSLTFSLPLAPAGMTIDPASGALAWSPGAGDVGRHDVTVQVADAEGLSDFTSFVATVRAVNAAPSARDDDYVVRVGEVLTVPSAEGVLANDEDPDGDPLAASLVEPPAQGVLSLAADGSLEYTPDVLGGRVEEGIDLTHLTVPQVAVSSELGFGYVPENVIDGDLDTSWFSARDDEDAWVDLLFLHDVAVRQIELFGNRQDGSGPYDFTSGVFDLYDRGGGLLFSSGEIVLPAPDRDVVVDVTALAGGPVEGVARLRFRATGYEGSAEHGIAELRVVGDGRRTRPEPVIEWAWTAESIGSATLGHGQVLMTPTVADLDLDGRPEVLLVAEALRRLYVVDGADGAVLWSFDDVYHYSSSPVVGNLDGDPELEVAVVRRDQATISVLAHDGTLQAEFDTGRTSGEANLALADLDADGVPEIVVPGSNRIAAYHLDGGSLVELWVSDAQGCGNNSYRSNCIPVVADVDLDGRPEIVAGDVLYGADGSTERLGSGLGDGWNAVGNFDLDPYAEIVLVSGGDVWLLEHDLSVAWGPVALPSGGSGGAPTVADFDGDGQPEIGVAGSSRYVVFDTDGSVLWETPTVDASSNRTGSTVFDFQNDGSAEVVYRDEQRLWIFRGLDGAVLFETPVGSATTVEAPIVADVDADGAAEIVVSSDASRVLPEGGNRVPGLYVFGAAAGDWVRARPIWNQHSYHVTNVLLDGTIPADEEPNWLLPGLNDFRKNDFLPGEAARADRFTYRASDGAAASAPATVHIDLQPSNVAPEIVSTPRRTATVGFLYLHQVRATDLDGDPLTFALGDGPAAMEIDPATGLLRWEPGSGDLGDHPVAVRVTDDDGFSGYQGFTLTVGEPVEVPDLAGLDRGAAEAALAAVLLVPGDVREATHPTVPVGRVLGQSPAAGSVAELGSEVDFGLSLGPAPEDVDDDGDGFTENEGDCDDTDGGVFPGATDVPDDGIDQDCDGADAPRPIVGLLVEPATATLVAGEALDLAAWGVRADGTSQIFDALATWSAIGGVSVDDRGFAIATAAGPATVTATYGAHAASATLDVVAHDPSDDDAPSVEILVPADGDTVLGPLEVLGTASDPQLVRYELAISPADEESFTTLAVGGTGVVGGVLGTLDPTLMLNGLYTLRLRAVDAGGNIVADEVTVHLDGQQKVGHFSLQFSDLAVPLGVLPLEIVRRYDSRDSRRGDFGVGWRLEISTLEMTCTEGLGEGWYVFRSGLSYVLRPDAAKLCTLTLADGSTEVFDLVPSPSSSAIVPFSFLRAGFRGRPGTLGKLRTLDNPNLLIVDPQPGDVRLVDDTTLSTFSPQRFLYTAKDGTEYTVSLAAGVERVRDLNGNTIVIGPSGVEHSSGVGIDFTRDAAGRIVAITDPAGEVQTYEYSPAGDLVVHTDRAGAVTTYLYDRDHRILEVRDPLGRPVVRNDYDDGGRLVRTTTDSGRVIDYTYDVTGRVRTATDSDGEVTVQEYDERGNVIRGVDPLGGETRESYDEHDNPVSTTDPLGHTTLRTFDDQRNLLSETDPLGNTTTFTYDDFGRELTRTDPLGRVRRTEYDARGNPVLTVDSDGAETRRLFDARGQLVAVIDALGQRTDYELDAAGLPTAMIGPRGERREITYDAAGRAVVETDARGFATTTSYDPRGLVVGFEDPLGGTTDFATDARGEVTGVTDPLGETVTWTLDPAGRGPLSTTDTLGGTAGFTYDAEGNLVEAVDALGQRTQLTWDALERLVRTERADGSAREVDYDAAGRAVRTVDEEGRETRWEYDAAGRATRRIDAMGEETTFAYDDAGQVVGATDSLGRTTEVVYDAAGLPIRLDYPDGTSVSATYDALGRMSSRTDELGRTWSYGYDAQGNLTSVTDPLGGVTTHAWDFEGNRVTTTDAAGETTRFDYDALGRLVRTIRPDGGVEERAYDAVGNLTSITDAEGGTISLAYDSEGRLRTKTDADGVTTTYTYNAVGEVTAATDPRGTWTFTYDAVGRPVEVTQPSGATVTYTFDGAGAPTSITVTRGGDVAVTSYTYDGLGRLATVADGAGGTWTFEYDAIGRRSRVVASNGVETLYAYDARDRLLAVELRRGGVPFDRWEATLDAVGDKVRVERLDGSVTDYEHDDLRRLVREVQRNAAGTVIYDVTDTYDAVGNRRTRVDAVAGTTTTSTYGPGHRLVASGDLTFVHDADGNLLAQSGPAGTRSYRWDGENRLARVILEDGSEVAYAYDPFGNRVARTTAAGTVEYTLDAVSRTGHSQVLAEHDAATGAEIVRYVFGDDLLAQHRFGTRSDYHVDGVGNVRLLTDAAGTVVNAYRFAAFGELLEATEAVANVHLFHAERRDRQVGLDDLRARVYAPAVGVFLSPDPFAGLLSEPASLHKYQFGFANPLTWADPSGELPTLKSVVASLGILGTISLVFDVISIGATLFGYHRIGAAAGLISLATGLAALAAPKIAAKQAAKEAYKRFLARQAKAKAAQNAVARATIEVLEKQGKQLAAKQAATSTVKQAVRLVDDYAAQVLARFRSRFGKLTPTPANLREAAEEVAREAFGGMKVDDLENAYRMLVTGSDLIPGIEAQAGRLVAEEAKKILSYKLTNSWARWSLY